MFLFTGGVDPLLKKMKLTKDRVTSLSKSILDRLLRKDLLEIQIPHEELIRKMDQVMINELLVEDRLNEEVKEILKSYQIISKTLMTKKPFGWKKPFSLVTHRIFIYSSQILCTQLHMN